MKPETWTSVDQMLEDASESYRRALWHDQPVYVEILSEKDAITGAISPVTREWDVPLGIVRGYSSETFCWHTARDLRDNIEDGKHCYLYQLGDHDPSGVDAWESASTCASSSAVNSPHTAGIRAGPSGAQPGSGRRRMR